MQFRKYGIAQVLSIVTGRRDVLGRLERKAKRASARFAQTVLKIYRSQTLKPLLLLGFAGAVELLFINCSSVS